MKKIVTIAAAVAIMMSTATTVSASIEKDVRLNSIGADTFTEFCEFRDAEFEKVSMNSWIKDGRMVEFIYDYKKNSQAI